MKKLNLIIYLIELKYRFLYSVINIAFLFIILFEYKIELFFLISESFLSLQKQFIYTSILEPLIIYIKVVCIITIISFLPFCIYIFSFFFIKAIYNIYIKIYSILVFSLFCINFFFYFFFFSLLLNFLFLFFLSFQRNKENVLLQLKLEATMQHYFSFFFFLVTITVLLIFIPIIFFLFINVSIFKNFFFSDFIFRKPLYFLITGLFLTIAPPDFIVQIFVLPFIFCMVEIYIYVLFFFHILYYTYAVLLK